MAIKQSQAKRKIIRAGRRGGKTTIAAILSVESFLERRRILYATPTSEQIERFWFEVTSALAEPIDAGVFEKNETMHFVEIPNTQVRIRAKTAWNADSLRGDYADLLILDEWQLMDESAWELVGAPMLLDNNGDAIFIYTPPSLHSRSVSKARDPRHAAKMYQRALQDTTGRWAAFHFSSQDNPHISREALQEIASDMTALAYRQEILAEDVQNVPGAIWTQTVIDMSRVQITPELVRIVIGVDPPGGATECGIVAAGLGRDGHCYILEDASLRASPDGWANAVLALYERWRADRVIGEKNYGGDMVESTVRTAAKNRNIEVSYRDVHATRGKALRAEPIAARYEQGKIHHAGTFAQLEDEMTMWIPGQSGYSPNRMDALVWALTAIIERDQQPSKMENRMYGKVDKPHNPLGLDLSDPKYIDRD